MKLLKYALAGAAALLTLAVGAAAWLVYTFDASDYHPRIVRYVKDATGRTLRIHGELTLTFRPDPVLHLGRVSLSERDSDAPFVDVEDARIGVQLRPLFSREFVADEVRIAGAQVRLTRFPDGRLNIDDLFRREGGTAQFDIGRVKVERSALFFRDLAARKEYALTDIALETGRIANAVPTPVVLALKARDAAGTFDVLAGIKGRLTFDLPQQAYRLEEANVVLKGRVPSSERFDARVNGDFAATLEDVEVRASRVAAAVAAVINGEPVEANLNAANVTARPERAQAETVTWNVKAAGAAGKTLLQANLPRLERAGETLHADRAALNLDLDRGGHAVRAAATGRLEVGLDTGAIALGNLESSFSVTGARLPAKGIAGSLTGEARVDVAKEALSARLAGKVAESKVKIDLTTAGFASPVYTFALDIDQLDADRYLASGSKSAGPSSGGFDLSALESLPATGTLHIGVLKAGGTKATNVKLAVKP